MADNVGYTPGTGATVAADDIAGALHQRVKISVGADGSASDWEGAVTVAGGATSAKQDTIIGHVDGIETLIGTTNTSLSSIDGKITACNTGAVIISSSALPSGAATAAKQPALGTAGTPSTDVITIQGRTGMTAVKVDGSDVTQPVSGSVDVSGSSVSISSGSVDVTNVVTTQGADDVSSSPSYKPNTMALEAYDDMGSASTVGDGQIQRLRGTTGGSLYVNGPQAEGAEWNQKSVPIGGKVRDPRSGPWASEGQNVFGTFDGKGQIYVTTDSDTPPTVTVTGSVSTSSSDGTTTVSISSSGSSSTSSGLQGKSTATVILTSLGTGGTVIFEGSVNGTNYVTMTGTPVAGGTPVTGSSATGSWQFDIAGLNSFRVRATALTSGTIQGQIRTSYGSGWSAGLSPLPAGSNTIGAVTQASGPWTSNVTQLNSTTIDTNSGNKSAGTMRVVLATDQPQLTNKLLVTPDANSTVVASGDVAHDAGDSGSPVKVGAQARTTNPTAVADGDRCNLITDKLGKLIAVGAIRDLKGNQQTKITSSTGETTIVTAVASTYLDLYGLTIANTSATACKVTIKDDTAGTTRFVFQVPAGDTRGFMVPVDSAHVQSATNKNWTATCGTSVDSIEITALFVKNT